MRIQQIQPGKRVLDHAAYTAPVIQIRNISALKYLDHELWQIDRMQIICPRLKNVPQREFLARATYPILVRANTKGFHRTRRHSGKGEEGGRKNEKN